MIEQSPQSPRNQNSSRQKLFSQKQSKQTLSISNNENSNVQNKLKDKIKTLQKTFSKHEQNWLNFSLQQKKFNLTTTSVITLPKNDSRISSNKKKNMNDNENDKQIQFYFAKNNKFSKTSATILNKTEAYKSYNDGEVKHQQTISEKYSKIVQERFIRSAKVTRNYEKLGKQASGLLKQLNQIHKQFNI